VAEIGTVDYITGTCFAPSPIDGHPSVPEYNPVMRLLFRISLLVLIFGRSVLADWDRPNEHARLLSGLDLSRRGAPAAPEGQAVLASAAGEDIRISLSVSPARFDHDHARMVQTTGRDWWVVWDDDRQGSRKVFRQRYDSTGVTLGANELIAGSSIGADYTDPRLTRDTLGRIYFSWRDQTGGMIFLSRYAADGSVDWAPLLVNDTSLNSFAGPFDMTVFPDGQVVMVWEDYSALGSTIQTRLFSPSGTPLLGPKQVNSDGGSVSHWAPAVACASGSGFLVCWEDYRNGQADIYARQYTGSGSEVGSDFSVVPPPADVAAQYSPRVTYSVKDRYVIGWTDLRLGQEIYLQRYNQTTGLVGANQQVSSGHAMVLNRDLDLSSAASGKTHVVWSASGADNSIQSLLLDSGLVPAGLPEVINLSTTGQRWAPAAAFGRSGDWSVAWTEAVNDNPNIAMALFTASGTRRPTGELVVNDETLGAHSIWPQIVATTGWWNLVAYVSERYDRGDVFVRLVSNAGNVSGAEARVNQDAGSSLQAEPSFAASSQKVLLVWNDTRTLAGFSGQRIYGRWLSLYGDFLTDEFLISDSLALASKSGPQVAVRSDGSGLVSWLDRRGGTLQVFARWLSGGGLPDGSDILISQPAQDLALVRLAAGSDNSDRVSVAWFDAGSATPTVRVRRFNGDRSDAGSFTYAPTTPAKIEDAAVDFGPDGRTAIFWAGSAGGVRRGYLTLLSANGTILDGPVIITDSPNAQPTALSVSMCENLYFSLTWIDRREVRPLAYYQILDPDLVPQSANQPVSSSPSEFMQNPATDASHGRAWFVWSDPRQDGLNVYGRPVVYLPTDVDESPSELPGDFHLAQNYPNPFNPVTDIEFSIPVMSQVELTIFNVLGQEVTTLADDVRAAGVYHVVWDGTDERGSPVASGVYFYRLKAGEFVATRKMMLLK